MNILGVNCYIPGSAVVGISNNHIIGASKESHFTGAKADSSFPRNSLRWLREYFTADSIVFPYKKHYNNFKESAKPFCKCIELVDYRNALAMSSISTTSWDTCAVAVFDTYYTSLGYYVDNEFFWLLNFEYPNNLSLFYSAATKFLGYNPLEDEHNIWEASRYAEPTYSALIQDKIVSLDAEGYNLKVNLERGLGVGPFNAEIASSVQHIYTKIVMHLLHKLKKIVSLDKIAIAGIGANNIVTNTSICGLYNSIATHPASGATAVAQGAAALYSRPVWENAYLGVNTVENVYADYAASELLKNKEVTVKQGRKAFSHYNLGNTDCTLSIPYKHKIQTNSYLVVQESMYADIFTGTCSRHICSYSNIKIPQIKSIDGLAKVMAVTSSSNPYINRVLELTKQQGYPVLAVKDNDIHTQ